MIRVPRDFDFNKLYYPSFILPLLDVENNRVIKIYGYCRGLILKKYDSYIEVKHDDRACIEYAVEVLGLWMSAETMIKSVDRAYRDFVEVILSVYGWLGIATSSRDDVEIFTSIFLSRTTDFHRNTVRWVRRILSIGIDRVLSNTTAVGRNFLLKQYPHALEMYLRIRDKVVLLNDTYSVRKLLLSIDFAGPKVSDAYILFVKKVPSIAPVDRNLINFLKRFDYTASLVNSTPRKDLCLKYSCDMCPHRQRCTSYRFREAFRDLSGWLQTIAYVHNGMYCRLRRCCVCMLRRFCKTPIHT